MNQSDNSLVILCQQRLEDPSSSLIGSSGSGPPGSSSSSQSGLVTMGGIRVSNQTNNNISSGSAKVRYAGSPNGPSSSSQASKSSYYNANDPYSYHHAQHLLHDQLNRVQQSVIVHPKTYYICEVYHFSTSYLRANVTTTPSIFSPSSSQGDDHRDILIDY